MPTATYVPLQTINVAANNTVNTMQFTSFSGYTDLHLVLNAKGQSSGSAGSAWFRVNGQSGSNTSWNWTYMSAGPAYAAMTSRSQSTNKSPWNWQQVISGTTFELMTADFFNYSATDKYKQGFSRSGSPELSVEFTSWQLMDTAAITTIEIGMDGSQYFAGGSSATLYGILGA
jgi:hypothetical protein